MGNRGELSALNLPRKWSIAIVLTLVSRQGLRQLGSLDAVQDWWPDQCDFTIWRTPLDLLTAAREVQQ